MRAIEIPIYSKDDLYKATKDGDTHTTDFVEFISGLLLNSVIDHETEIAVAKIIDDKGTEVLSEKQMQVANIILNKYGARICNRCQCDIPLTEVAESYDNGGYCSYCANAMDKDD